MLSFDGFLAAALADELVLILDLGEKVDDAAGILLEVRRVAFDGRFQDRIGHAAPSRRSDDGVSVYRKNCQERDRDT
jgi:hypothetical protein